MLTSVWTSIKNGWNKFETWVYSWMPGWKTHVVTGLGALGSGAAVLQEYVTQLPLATFVNANQLALVTMILFTLAFWFHNMGSRVSIPGTTS